MADEPAGGGTGSQLPEPQSFVPRRRKGIGTVGTNNLINPSAEQRALLGFMIHVRSQRRCERGREAIAWGNHTEIRRE